MAWQSVFISRLDTIMPYCGFFASACGLWGISAFRVAAYFRSEVLAYLAVTGWAGLILWWWSPDPDWFIGVWWFISFILGLAFVFWWRRHGVQRFDRFKSRWTLRSALVRGDRTDVRDVAASLPQPRREYDPRAYHRENDFFMGVGQDGKPIYWHGSLPHLVIAGATGAGKGRKLQDLAAQSIARGEALVYLDPKDDAWGAHAVYAACQDSGRKFHFISLLPEQPPQLNILEGAKAWEIEELLSVALDLGDKGKGSDFYKTKDRAAARHAAALAARNGLTLAAVYREMVGDSNWQEAAPAFLDKLGELAALPAIHARVHGISLPKFIDEGGAIYAVGSMTFQSVRRAQQMLFVRVQQIASARDRVASTPRTVCVIADEAKYHVSRPILQGLGASRDKGMRVILACQSFLDLRDCPADMDPDAVVGAVIENTPVKLVYRIEDPDTADWFERKSGRILVDDEIRALDRNGVLSETTQGDRSIRQAEDYLISSNELTNLPPGWSVLYGVGLAQFCYVSPYRVEKRGEAITVVPAAGEESSDIALSDSPNQILNQPRPAKRGGKDNLDSAFFSLKEKG